MNPRVEQADSTEYAVFSPAHLIRTLFGRSRKIHDFTLQEPDIDFSFEPFSQNAQGYLTGQGSGIRPGDFVVLKINSLPQKYEVKEMDFYSSSDVMWIARLVRVRPSVA